MARFEPDPDSRPRPPRPRPAPHPAADEPAQAGAWITRLGSRRLVPRVRLRLPKFIRSRLPDLPPEVRHRWELLSGYLQVILIVVFAFAAIAILLSVVTRVSITEPGDARAVLDRVENPEDVAFSVETVRIKKIDGVELRHDSLRGMQVDMKRRRFRAQVSGLDEETFRLVGDGKIVLYQRGSAPPARLRSYPSAEALMPVLASDLHDRAGELVTNKATVRGQRGWLITWKPDRETLLRMLSVDLLRSDGEDIRAIRAGKFRVRSAVATVLRNARALYQLEARIEVNGADLRVLVTYRANNTGRLKGFDLSREDARDTP